MRRWRSGTTSAATTEAGEPLPTGLTGGGTVWYRLDVGTTGNLSVNLSSSQPYMGVALYRGTAFANLVKLAEGTGSAVSSSVNLGAPVTAGQIYYVQVGSLPPTSGPSSWAHLW